MDHADALLRALCQVVDNSTGQRMPGGVSDDPRLAFTNDCFNFWLAAHGLPKTANEARAMFEYAATLGFMGSEIMHHGDD